MKKILGFAGAIALSIIPTPSFSGEVEQKEMMSVTEQLLPQIGEKYYYLNKKEKKAYKKDLLKYLKKVEKLEPTGVGENISCNPHTDPNFCSRGPIVDPFAPDPFDPCLSFECLGIIGL